MYIRIHIFNTKLIILQKLHVTYHIKETNIMLNSNGNSDGGNNIKYKLVLKDMDCDLAIDSLEKWKPDPDTRGSYGKVISVKDFHTLVNRGMTKSEFNNFNEVRGGNGPFSYSLVDTVSVITAVLGGDISLITL